MYNMIIIKPNMSLPINLLFEEISVSTSATSPGLGDSDGNPRGEREREREREEKHTHITLIRNSNNYITLHACHGLNSCKQDSPTGVVYTHTHNYDAILDAGNMNS